MDNSEFDVEIALEKARRYINQYDRQMYLPNYSQDAWLQDMLYMIGISISEDYRWGPGFAAFKAELLRTLEEEA